MKKILLIPVVLLLASCYNIERNCKDFKTGKFRFDFEVEGVTKTTIFERNDSLEIEHTMERQIQPPYAGSMTASIF